MKKVCIVCNGYPTKEDPTYAFIQPIAQAISEAGYECIVIAPQRIVNSIIKRRKTRPYRWIDKASGHNEVIVLQPRYFSLSNLSLFKRSFSIEMRDKSIIRCIKKEKIIPDVVYAHFWDCGIAAAKAFSKMDIPVYVASGESQIRVFSCYDKRVVEKYLKNIRGVIGVSTNNLIESKNKGLLKYSPKTIVLPNAVNPNEFHPINRKEARKHVGLKETDKIAVFVGAFSERKGVLRVVEAAKEIPDLKLILIGDGSERPQSDQIVFCGKLSHREIQYYLNSADVFILPTLAEGCCNAIVEALACGLPVISSNLPFNMDILDSNNSILIDPAKVDEIVNAMQMFFCDKEYREKLEANTIATAKSHSIFDRCNKLVEFLDL